MYKIPLFDLNYGKEEEQAVLEVLRSKWISTGPKVAEFEEKFANMLKIKHAVCLANCTVALHLAMKLVGISQDDEVICPSLTFVATANAIRYVNAIPVFADIRGSEDLTIDPQDIMRKITPRTKAIIVMHYGGFACDMNSIMDLAAKHSLKIIEDSCHGPLSEYEGKRLGTIGDVGCFSFFSNKNISTGEGGMIVTNNPEYCEKAKLLRTHGMTSISYERTKGHATSYDVIDLGYNYRMDDMHASLGIIQLNKLRDDLERRAVLRKYYIDKLSSFQRIAIPFINYYDFSSNYIFPIILKEAKAQERDDVRKKMAEAGIQTSVHYPAVHKFSIYRDFYLPLPKTDSATESEITLPMFSKLNFEMIDYIVATLGKILK